MFLLCMMKLKVHIEEMCKHPAGKTVTLARSSLDFNENVTFPFESLISSFKLLYPDKHLIFNFTII